MSYAYSTWAFWTVPKSLVLEGINCHNLSFLTCTQLEGWRENTCSRIYLAFAFSLEVFIFMEEAKVIQRFIQDKFFSGQCDWPDKYQATWKYQV